MHSPESLRSHSLHLTNSGENVRSNFGDDQNITYSEEKVKLTHPSKKSEHEDSKDLLQLPENSASKGSNRSQISESELTPIKINIPDQKDTIPEVDEAAYGSPKPSPISKPVDQVV